MQKKRGMDSDKLNSPGYCCSRPTVSVLCFGLQRGVVLCQGSLFLAGQFFSKRRRYLPASGSFCAESNWMNKKKCGAAKGNEYKSAAPVTSESSPGSAAISSLHSRYCLVVPLNNILAI
jgi:hypothetical protein